VAFSMSRSTRTRARIIGGWRCSSSAFSPGSASVGRRTRSPPSFPPPGKAGLPPGRRGQTERPTPAPGRTALRLRRQRTIL